MNNETNQTIKIENSLMKFSDGIFKDKKIRITNNYVSVFDIIQVAGGQKNPRIIWERLLKKGCNFEICYLKFSGAGQRDTPCILIDDTKKLLISFLPSCRISRIQKENIIKEFNIDVNLDKQFLIRDYIEEEIHDKIIKVFKNYNLKQQFSVLSYRIDLFFTDFKIAIECDENSHSNYNKEKEIKRMELITEEIKCTWIRYDPYGDNFCIFDLIHNINVEIIKNNTVILI